MTQGGADISDCGRYRYRLWREGWSADDRACLFFMLNPSTADGVEDDPTIRKCVGFCKRWGYGRLFVVNLFAFRSTAPKGLLQVDSPVGPDNDVWIYAELAAASRIVLAWGSHPEVRHLMARRVEQIRSFVSQAKTVTLGSCKDGQPRHPLMLSYATQPVPVR
jgi:hypothetical protein